MLVYASAYIVALIVFAAMDITWLSTMGAKLYTQTLRDILAPEIRMGPAAAFYLLYPIGIVIFAVAPALKTGSLSTAMVYGALFGAFTYGTYELTNFATLRSWTLGITIIDIAYGAVMGLVVATVSYWLAPVLARGFGG
jgi:uncharacterized membrane protein